MIELLLVACMLLFLIYLAVTRPSRDRTKEIIREAKMAKKIREEVDEAMKAGKEQPRKWKVNTNIERFKKD